MVINALYLFISWVHFLFGNYGFGFLFLKKVKNLLKYFFAFHTFFCVDFKKYILENKHLLSNEQYIQNCDYIITAIC